MYIHRPRLYDDVSKFMKTRYRVFPLSNSYIVPRPIVIEGNKFFNRSKLTFDPYETIRSHTLFFFPFFFSFFNHQKFNHRFVLNEPGAKTSRAVAIYIESIFSKLKRKSSLSSISRDSSYRESLCLVRERERRANDTGRETI